MGLADSEDVGDDVLGRVAQLPQVEHNLEKYCAIVVGLIYLHQLIRQGFFSLICYCQCYLNFKKNRCIDYRVSGGHRVQSLALAN